MQTARTVITQLSVTDKQDVWLLYSNKDVRKYLGGTVSQDQFNHKFNTICEKADANYFVIRNQHQSFIGLVSFTTHHNGQDIEVSYQFLPKWWGKGYAIEVLKSMIEYAFANNKFSKLLAETQTKNIASCKILEKLGFTLQENLIRFNELQSIYCINK